MDYEDLYQNTERPSEAPTPIYVTYEATEPAPKKKHAGLKLAALALVFALIGGTLGAGLESFLLERRQVDLLPLTTDIQVSDRIVPEVRQVRVDGKQELTLPEVYEANINSVASINTYARQNVFGQVVENASSGSGFLITKDGYIVTNYHVIEGANRVNVTLKNGETYEAEIIGGDEDYDIAVIHIEGSDFTPVVLGDSSALRIGETIAAIGNPLGELTFSMSRGIVSCVDRAINVDGVPFNMIQVDCAVNPGNSGGPLVNTYGEVVGIVSAKYSTYSSTTVEGVGFAIPINDVLAMIKDIMTNGYVTNKPYLGISAGTLTASLAQQYRYDISKGVLVYSVEEGSAAEQAGLQRGDVITKIGSDAINSLDDLTAAKKKYAAGDTVTMELYRDGETLRVEFTFGAQPTEKPQAQQPAQDQPSQQYPNYNYPNGNNYYDIWDYLFGRGFGGFGG